MSVCASATQAPSHAAIDLAGLSPVPQTGRQPHGPGSHAAQARWTPQVAGASARPARTAQVRLSPVPQTGRHAQARLSRRAGALDLAGLRASALLHARTHHAGALCLRAAPYICVSVRVMCRMSMESMLL